MLLELSEEQSLLRGSLEQLLKKHQSVPLDRPAYALYSEELQQELTESGFLDVAAADDFGPLEAALVVEAVARSPWAVEVAGSALIAPALQQPLLGAFAMCEGVGRPTRYLAQANHAIVLDGNDLLLAEFEPGEVEAVESVLAYPIGILRQKPKRSRALNADDAATARQLWQIGLAAEAAGLMRAALDQTVAQVKDRRQFGHPLGDFQAIQHRLAIDEQIVSASFLLAMRGAHSQRPDDVATAALYVQENMRKVIYDCHQFSGAMGLTLEYPLHLWTYRLKFIQGELGGRATQAQAAAEVVF